MDRTALIIVDVQNDFCPGGALAVKGGDEIVPMVNRLKSEFGISVVTQDYHPADHAFFASNHEGAAPFTTIDMPYGPQILWPDHCVEGTTGVEFHPDLVLSPNDLVLRKGQDARIHSFSGFFEDDGVSRPHFADGSTLTEKLRELGVENVVVCGLAYDFCAGFTALHAQQEGFQTTIIKDACRSIAMPLANGATTETQMDEKLNMAGVTIANIDTLNAPAAPLTPASARKSPVPL